MRRPADDADDRCRSPIDVDDFSDRRFTLREQCARERVRNDDRLRLGIDVGVGKRSTGRRARAEDGEEIRSDNRCRDLLVLALVLDGYPTRVPASVI